MDKPWLKFYDPDVPPSIELSPIPFYKILDEAADRFPARPAVFFFGGKIKYGLLRAQANQLASALLAQGFQPGDSLGLLLPNMPQTIVSLFGALKAGGKVAFFDPLANREELRDQLNKSGVETVVLLDLVYSRIQAVLPQTRVKKLIVSRVKDYLPFPKDFFFSLAARGYGLNIKLEKTAHLLPFMEFLATGRQDWAPPTSYIPSPEEIAVVHYLSFPGGVPEKVEWTQAGLIANIRQASAWLGKIEKGREVFLSVLPCHQPEGLTLAMNLPISLGAMSVQLPQFDIGRALMMIKKHRVSFLPATHDMAEAVANRPLFGKKELSSIRTFWSVGPELAPEILENLGKKIGGTVSTAYGPPEAMTLTHANPLYGKRKTGSIGIPLPDTEAKIVDPARPEREMPAGEKGELVVRGPQVMTGSAHRSNEAQKALGEGWLHTGDFARMDEDGFFYVMGRINEKSPQSTDHSPR